MKTMDRNDHIRSGKIPTQLKKYVPSTLMPWNTKRAYHVLRRLQYGVNKKELNELLIQNPTDFIDKLIDDAINKPFVEAPSWIDVVPPSGDVSDEARKNYIKENRIRILEYRLNWLELMKTHSFREKMVLFWHNHFVTEIATYKHAPLAHRYLTCLRENCLGNFKDFTHKIGLEYAMLIYLDGTKNRKNKPNENYSRELLELFTMGIGNYTEDDVKEIARALTGFKVNKSKFEVIFEEKKFDNGEKSFLGRTGEFNYDDTIDIIFEERSTEIANFICTKIYQYFVYDLPNQSIIDSLADTFLSHNFEIEPVLRQLLKSEHFFDSEILGAKIKSPVDFILQIQKELNITNLKKKEKLQVKWLQELGQDILNPINVSGWRGYRSWISTDTLAIRWNLSDKLLNKKSFESLFDYRELINSMSDPDDPNILAKDLANYFISVELTEKDKDELVTILLSGMPDYEWNMNLEDDAIIWRLRNFVGHLFQLPEYQLM